MSREFLIGIAIKVAGFSAIVQGVAWLLGIDEDVHALLKEHVEFTLMAIVLWGCFSYIVYDAARKVEALRYKESLKGVALPNRKRVTKRENRE